jgi:hypothetical protein
MFLIDHYNAAESHDKRTACEADAIQCLQLVHQMLLTFGTTADTKGVCSILPPTAFIRAVFAPITTATLYLQTVCTIAAHWRDRSLHQRLTRSCTCLVVVYQHKTTSQSTEVLSTVITTFCQQVTGNNKQMPTERDELYNRRLSEGWYRINPPPKHASSVARCCSACC